MSRYTGGHISRSGQSRGQSYDIISGQSYDHTDSYANSHTSSHSGSHIASHAGSYHHSPSHHADHYSSHSHDPYGAQVQSQQHVFRSAQASKQMVYEVFGNTITMLEEMEQRELKKQKQPSLSRSDIYLPNQAEHDDKTITRKLDTQLLLLQSQLNSCDKEIKDATKQELKTKTLDWNSQRQAKDVKRGETDKYVGKLYEVLHKGQTEHPSEFYKSPSISERDMQKTMNAYMAGSMRRSELDSGFRNDPNKRAKTPKIRAGAGTELGAERLAGERPDMDSSLNKYREGKQSWR